MRCAHCYSEQVSVLSSVAGYKCTVCLCDGKASDAPAGGMPPEVYAARKDALRAEYENRCRELLHEYGLSNSKAGIGDVIQDRFGVRIRVSRIEVKDYAFVICAYSGPRLTHDDKPMQGGPVATIFQSDLI